MHSTIRFDVSKKKSWNAKTNEYLPEPSRLSDCYVFCVYVETENVNVLDINGWRFYVVLTKTIDEIFGEQKSVSLNKLQAISKEIPYQKLKKTIDSIFP